MEIKELTADQKSQDLQREGQITALHINQVQDRALPASTVLGQRREESDENAPTRLFVP